MITYIIGMIVFGVFVLIMLKRTGKNEAVSFSLKCPECGFHKGILKCIHCEDRKKDKWR